MARRPDRHKTHVTDQAGTHGVVVNVLLPLLLVIVALGIGAVLIGSPPHVPRSNPEVLAPVVGTAELTPHDTKVFIHAFGSVVPAREMTVIPEVSGRVTELNKHLQQGGLVAKGDLLIKIDPVDYDIAVAQAQANLDVAQHEVTRLQAGIQPLRERLHQLSVEIDYLEWNARRLGGLAEKNSAAESEARDAVTKLESEKAARQTVKAEIVAQEQAVTSAEAKVHVSERVLETAKLSLERTAISAPFDAVVVREDVEIGQFVGAQSEVATLVAADEFWVEASIDVARLRDIRFAVDDPDDPSLVNVSLTTSADPIVWQGVVLRPLGRLDPLGRMARVLITIKDPLGVERKDVAASRRMLLGSYVRLEIEAGMLKGVYAIPRKALRENDQIWVRDADGQLAIRPVQIVWRRHEDVLVRNGFRPNDRLVTTHLASVIPGMALRVRDESPVPKNAGLAAPVDPLTDGKPVSKSDAESTQ